MTDEDCEHYAWRLRIVEEEPVVVELRCYLCDAFLWLGGEQGGINAQGQVVKLE